MSLAELIVHLIGVAYRMSPNTPHSPWRGIGPECWARRCEGHVHCEQREAWAAFTMWYRDELGGRV